MAISRNHWFKVIVGEEDRLFRGVGLNAEGLYSKLRRIAHDCDPYGFLVDHASRPLTQQYMADCVHLRNGEFSTILRELRERRIILSAVELEAQLSEAAMAVNKRSRTKLQLFLNLASKVVGNQSEVLTVPGLVDQHLETLFGLKFNPRGAEVLPFDGGEGRGAGWGGTPSTQPPAAVDEGYPPTLPLYPPGEESPATVVGRVGDSQSQKSESKTESKAESKPRKKKRTSATAREEGEEPFELRLQTDAPWSWQKHLYLCDQVQKFDASLSAEVRGDPTRYPVHFFAKFGYALEVFQRAQEIYEFGPNSPPLPQSCVEGDHIDDGAGRCVNCRVTVHDRDVSTA